MTDLELLRRHEPIIRFTAGELFYPCRVDDYVKECSLWTRRPDGTEEVVVERGGLDLESLAAHGLAMDGTALSLRFVEEPLSPREYQQWLARPDRVRFHAPGRLARVPPWSRLLDSAFNLSLIVRGTVPGGTAAAAQVRYAEMLKQNDRRAYYGRVVRAGPWTVLQYLFFYAMNDWRSSFHGANDHEADWEQVLVYLYETEAGTLEPRWVACASHDDYGDKLRRRWDDPVLVREGTHPVVFVAAGSHAAYLEQGEYLMGVEPPLLAPVRDAVDWLRRFWVERLGQGLPERTERTLRSIVSVPFVDYARGDGPTIGPGGDAEWDAVVISDDLPWVSDYRGLWGLETQDPFGGERAPAGPKYNRDGSVRLSWSDPLGFVGLGKVLPPTQLGPALDARRQALTRDIERIDRRIARMQEIVRTRALDEAALRDASYSGATHEDASARLLAAETKLRELMVRRSSVVQTREFVQRYAARVRAGIQDDPTAHLEDVHRPDPAPRPRRVFQIWSALSGAFALLAVVVLLVVFPAHWWFWLLGAATIFSTIEAAAEGRLISFLSRFAIVLAIVSAGVLIIEFWRTILVVLLGLAIAALIRDNLEELRKTPPPAPDGSGTSVRSGS